MTRAAAGREDHRPGVHGISDSASGGLRVAVSLVQATAWVQAALPDDSHRRGSVITTAREWAHGWMFVCLQSGQESATLSPCIVDSRDGVVYTASSVIGADRATEVIRAGPEAVAASRRVFRVGVVGVGQDAVYEPPEVEPR